MLDTHVVGTAVAVSPQYTWSHCNTQLQGDRDKGRCLKDERPTYSV